MFEPNPNTIRIYRCDRCGRVKSVTVVKGFDGDDVCECGGQYRILIKEIKL